MNSFCHERITGGSSAWHHAYTLGESMAEAARDGAIFVYEMDPGGSVVRSYNRIAYQGAQTEWAEAEAEAEAEATKRAALIAKAEAAKAEAAKAEAAKAARAAKAEAAKAAKRAEAEAAKAEAEAEAASVGCTAMASVAIYQFTNWLGELIYAVVISRATTIGPEIHVFEYLFEAEDFANHVID